MIKKKLVSCVMLTYTQTNMLAEAIEMFFDQSYEHKELILIDSGSINHYEWVENNIIKQLDDRKKDVVSHIYINNTKYDTIGKLRNFAMRLCNGEYIAFFDDDDKWSRDRLEVQIKALDSSGDGKAMNTIDRYDIMFANNMLRIPIHKELNGSIVLRNNEYIRDMDLFGKDKTIGGYSEYDELIESLISFGYKKVPLCKVDCKRYDLVTFRKTQMNATKECFIAEIIDNFTDEIEKNLRERE